MTEPFTLDQIQEFWTQQARTHGQAPAASWSDLPMIEMEIRQLLSRLQDGDRVLDVGCGNGYSTVRLATERDVVVRGLDYIPDMIHQAKLRLADAAEVVRSRVTFAVGDVTALDDSTDAYDKVVAVRVIINLATWTRQQQGLRECARVLKPGGMLLLSEATLQGWRRLNAFRREWSLPDIPVPSFNRYLDEDQVVEAVKPRLQLVEMVNFASTYFVGTRILKPLLIKALHLDLDPADTNVEWNRWCALLPEVGDYGTQKLFVFRRS